MSAFFTFLPVHKQHSFYFYFFNAVHFYSHWFLIMYLWLEILQIFHFL